MITILENTYYCVSYFQLIGTKKHDFPVYNNFSFSIVKLSLQSSHFLSEYLETLTFY